MAKRRLSMRKIKEVLRLKWVHKLSDRQIAKSCSIFATPQCGNTLPGLY
ncbi:MAG: hypothetical protein HWN71_09750 [Desulfobacterales bacterium]|nr:hypothetical protein [Desulfobacterales bacterium]